MFAPVIYRQRSLANLPRTLDWADRIFREMMPSVWGEQADLMPAFDLSEAEDHFVLKADLPGMEAGNLDISLTGNVLTIKGEKKDEKKEEKENFHYCERRFGSFSRSFRFPSDVKEEGIEATYKDGVLQVKIPKTEAAAQKKIEVKVN